MTGVQAMVSVSKSGRDLLGFVILAGLMTGCPGGEGTNQRSGRLTPDDIVTPTNDKLTDLTPHDPGSVKAEGIGPNEIRVHWQAGEGAEEYLVAMREGDVAPESCDKILARETGLETTIAGLKPFTAYSLRVCAATTGESALVSDGVAVENVMTLDSPANDPLSVTVAASSSTALIVTWTSEGTTAGHVMAYEANVTPDPGCRSGTLVDQAALAGKTTHTLSGLKPFMPYGVRVCAVNRDGTRSTGTLAAGRPLPTHMLVAVTGTGGGVRRISLSDWQVSTLVDDQGVNMNRRGIMSVPGGFIAVNDDAGSPSAYHTNLGEVVEGPSPQLNDNTHQAIGRLSGGYYMIPQYFKNVVYVFREDTGEFVKSFGQGKLTGPFRAIETDDGRVLVSSPGSARIVEFRRDGLTFTWQRDYTSYDDGGSTASFSYPNDVAYCAKDGSFYTADLSTGDLMRCAADGSCAKIGNHSTAYNVVVKMDPTSNDCSFFLGYGFGAGRLAKIAGDGTAINLDLTGNLGGSVFDLDFEIPAL